MKENNSNDKQSDLVDYLFGSRPAVSDRVIEMISDPDSIDEDKLLPVRVLSYRDPETKKVKKQLDSKGIRITMGLGEEGGVELIEQEKVEELLGDQLRETREVTIRNPQNNLTIGVFAKEVDEDEVLFRTELKPNQHGIESTGPKFYRIQPSRLAAAYRTDTLNVVSLAGVNIEMLHSYAVVDLINE